MKNLLWTLPLVVLLAPTAPAQVACNPAGVVVDVVPANPLSGELITLTLTNNSSETITLPSGCLITQIYANGDCSGPQLVGFLCPAIVIDIPPGSSQVGSWNQQDGFGMQVPDGDYSLRIQYFDSSFGGLLSCCVPVTIGFTPPTSFCSGDGGDQLGCTDCPCGNNAAPGTVGGCLNSAGTSARLSSSGDTSVSLPAGSTSDLRFALDGAPPAAFCILNSGDALAPQSMSNPCFGLDSGALSVSFDGLRCAVQNTQRHGGRSADVNGEVGTTNSPWGGEGAPAAGLANAFGGFSAGQTRYFQVIHREDPLAVCMRGLNTSQASEVTFTP